MSALSLAIARANHRCNGGAAFRLRVTTVSGKSYTGAVGIIDNGAVLFRSQEKRVVGISEDMGLEEKIIEREFYLAETAVETAEVLFD